MPTPSALRPLTEREILTVFVLYVILFLGGLYMMGAAFAVTELQGLLFTGGILVTSLAVAIPFILGSIERRGTDASH